MSVPQVSIYLGVSVLVSCNLMHPSEQKRRHPRHLIQVEDRDRVSSIVFGVDSGLASMRAFYGFNIFHLIEGYRERLKVR